MLLFFVFSFFQINANYSFPMAQELAGLVLLSLALFGQFQLFLALVFVFIGLYFLKNFMNKKLIQKEINVAFDQKKIFNGYYIVTGDYQNFIVNYFQNYCAKYKIKLNVEDLEKSDQIKWRNQNAITLFLAQENLSENFCERKFVLDSSNIFNVDYFFNEDNFLVCDLFNFTEQEIAKVFNKNCENYLKKYLSKNVVCFFDANVMLLFLAVAKQLNLDKDFLKEFEILIENFSKNATEKFKIKHKENLKKIKLFLLRNELNIFFDEKKNELILKENLALDLSNILEFLRGKNAKKVKKQIQEMLTEFSLNKNLKKRGKLPPCLFFTGDYGSGKTEAAKQLAQDIALAKGMDIENSENFYCYVSCDSQEGSDFLGSANGTVGNDRHAQITSKTQVIIFDEIDKIKVDWKTQGVLDVLISMITNNEIVFKNGEKISLSGKVLVFIANDENMFENKFGKNVENNVLNALKSRLTRDFNGEYKIKFKAGEGGLNAKELHNVLELNLIENEFFCKISIHQSLSLWFNNEKTFSIRVLKSIVSNLVYKEIEEHKNSLEDLEFCLYYDFEERKIKIQKK